MRVFEQRSLVEKDEILLTFWDQNDKTPNIAKHPVWFVGLVEVLGWKSNEWVTNLLGPGQTLQIKTRSTNQSL